MSIGLVLPAWSQGVPARAEPSRRLSRWFLLGMALLTLAYTTDPTSTRGTVTYVAISLSASLAVIVALLRHRPTVRAPWCLMAILPVLGCIGMALRLSMAPTSILVAVVPDLVTIPGYLLLLAAMIRLVRARRGTAPGGALDGGLMAVGGLLVSWTVVITPVFHTVGMPTAIKVVDVAYPTISVAILFVAALLAMNESTSIPAFWCLAGAWCSLIVGDVVYALASIGTTPVPLWVGNTGYCAFYALLGAAALDPSMVDLSRPTTKRVRPYGLSRFMAVAVALVLPAIVVAIHASCSAASCSPAWPTPSTATPSPSSASNAWPTTTRSRAWPTGCSSRRTSPGCSTRPVPPGPASA
jgi:hypothetical protein